MSCFNVLYAAGIYSGNKQLATNKTFFVCGATEMSPYRNAMSWCRRLLNVEMQSYEVQTKRLEMRFCLLPEIRCWFLAFACVRALTNVHAYNYNEWCSPSNNLLRFVYWTILLIRLVFVLQCTFSFTPLVANHCLNIAVKLCFQNYRACSEMGVFFPQRRMFHSANCCWNTGSLFVALS